jgi:hypothetical protein
VTVEDHTYDIPTIAEEYAATNIQPSESYRRRTLRTLVELRNTT